MRFPEVNGASQPWFHQGETGPAAQGSVMCNFVYLCLFANLQLRGTGPLIWFTAWPSQELELGRLRSDAMWQEDKKGGTECWDVSEATGSENCGLSAASLRRASISSH